MLCYLMSSYAMPCYCYCYCYYFLDVSPSANIIHKSINSLQFVLQFILNTSYSNPYSTSVRYDSLLFLLQLILLFILQLILQFYSLHTPIPSSYFMLQSFVESSPSEFSREEINTAWTTAMANSNAVRDRYVRYCCTI